MKVVPVQELFEYSSHYQIPEYQRNYAWSEDEVSEFLDDTRKSCAKNLDQGTNDAYLMGQILLCPNGSPPNGLPQNIESHEVIDGQQRLTTIYATILLLLANIDDSWVKEQNAGVNQAWNHWLGLRFLANNVDIDSPILRVSSNYVRREYWTAIYSGTPIPDAQTPSEENLDAAVSVIEKHLKELESNQEKWDYLTHLMNDVSIIVMGLPSSKLALQMFMNLNNRGMKLDPSDIIKAYFFRLASREDYPHLSRVWGDAQEELMGQKRVKAITSMQTLMRMLIQTELGTYVPQDDIFEKWEAYFEKQDDVSESVRQVAEQLPSKAKSLVTISKRKVPREEGVTLPELRGIEVLGARSFYQVLLAGSHLEANSFRELSKIVESRVVLQSFSNMPFQNLEPRIHKWSKDIRGLDPLCTRDDILSASKLVLREEDLTAMSADLHTGIGRLSYLKRIDQIKIRYILARSNNYLQRLFDVSTQSVDSFMATKTPTNRNGYDLDHIFPKAIDKREFWVVSDEQSRLFGDVDRSSSVLNSIGNLALLKGLDNEFSSDDLPWDLSKTRSYELSEIRLCNLLTDARENLLNHPPNNRALKVLNWPSGLKLSNWSEDSVVALTEFYSRIAARSLLEDLGLEYAE